MVNEDDIYTRNALQTAGRFLYKYANCQLYNC